jgi:hypothetical protein
MVGGARGVSPAYVLPSSSSFWPRRRMSYAALSKLLCDEAPPGVAMASSTTAVSVGLTVAVNGVFR